MTKAKPCAHRRWKITRRVAVTDHREDGQVETDPRKRYRVLEALRCVRCETAGTRWSRFYGATERAALKRAGVLEQDLPAPPNHKPKTYPVPDQDGLWPFPSTDRPLVPANQPTK